MVNRLALVLPYLLAPALAAAFDSCELPYQLKADAIHQIVDLDGVDLLEPGSWNCRRGGEEQLAKGGDGGQGNSQNCELLREYFSAGSPVRGRPTVGLALAGGGSKSAAYAMGVIEGLLLSGALPRVDYISSVSGGSYSAYFLYSRLLDRHAAFVQEGTAAFDEARAPLRWFEDSVPKELRAGDFSDEIAPLLEQKQYFDRHPYQARIRYYADVLSPYGNWQTSLDDRTSALVNAALLLGSHGITLWPLAEPAGFGLLTSVHHTTRTLFDWPVNTSPSRQAYRSGLLRAYGTGSPVFDPEADSISDLSGPIAERSFRDLDQLHADEIFQAACKEAEKEAEAALCQPPRWIVNASIAESASSFGWLEVPKRNFAANSFEMSSRAFGAGKYGYVFESHPEMTILDAVLASAAFFDSEQRSMDDQLRRTGAAVVQHAVNANWGTDWPNYNVCNSDRYLHYVLPFPLYYLHRFARDERSANIHLLDGGSVDNLGLLSLVRRRVQNIVVSDSASDASGTFQDVCRAKNELELIGFERPKTPTQNWQSRYELRIPPLEGLDFVCNRHLGPGYEARFGKETVNLLKARRLASCTRHTDMSTCVGYSDAAGYSVHHWTAPVLEGCVVHADKSQAADVQGCPEGAPGDEGSGVISRLFLLKPALDFKRWRNSLRQLEMASPSATEGRTSEQSSKPLIIKNCWHPYSNHGRGRPPEQNEQPCEALAFLKANLGVLRDSCPVFPQNNTVSMTFNSSYTLYGAYKDLARFHASFIEPDELRGLRIRQGGPVGPMRPIAESLLENACKEEGER